MKHGFDMETYPRFWRTIERSSRKKADFFKTLDLPEQDQISESLSDSQTNTNWRPYLPLPYSCNERAFWGTKEKMIKSEVAVWNRVGEEGTVYKGYNDSWRGQLVIPVWFRLKTRPLKKVIWKMVNASKSKRRIFCFLTWSLLRTSPKRLFFSNWSLTPRTVFAPWLRTVNLSFVGCEVVLVVRRSIIVCI